MAPPVRPIMQRPTPVLPQRVRTANPLPPESRSRPVLQRSGTPAQMSLFQRPSANDSG